MIEQIVIGFFSAFSAALFALYLQEKKLKAEMRTEFQAEAAIKRLLERPEWERRSLHEIRRRIGGFSKDDLRQILVRCGAVRFTSDVDGDDDKKEFWGLISRNEAEV